METSSANFTMVAGTFKNVTQSEGKFTMRDLKVTPKEGTTFKWVVNKWTGGINPSAFVLNILNADGTSKATYNWQYSRSGTKTVYTDTAKWVKSDGGSGYVDLTDAELDATMDAGLAFWIKGSGHSLTPAGAVNEKLITFPTSASNYTAAGNGTPVELTLGDLSVTPKEGTAFKWVVNKWTGGINPSNFEINFLNPDGSSKATYNWKYSRSGTKTVYTDSTVWVKPVGSEYVELTKDELDAIKVPAGQGLWIKGSGHTLNVPAPKL